MNEVVEQYLLSAASECMRIYHVTGDEDARAAAGEITKHLQGACAVEKKQRGPRSVMVQLARGGTARLDPKRIEALTADEEPS